MMKQDDVQLVGGKHQDTKTFDDSKHFDKYQGASHKIKELIVHYNDHQVIGIHANYFVFGWNQVIEGEKHTGNNHHGAKEQTITLRNNEYITEIFGRAGAVIDNIGFRTSQGNSFEFGGKGGKPFEIAAPYGQHYNILRGGYGGDLHFIDFITEPLPEVGGFQPFQAKEDEFFRGKRNPDTKEFSDEEVLRGHGGQHKIKTLHVYHDGDFVVGLQADYFVYGPNEIVKGATHASNASAKKSTVELENDEFITTISGRHGDIIDHLRFLTNKGREFNFGGQGGNPFEIKAPHGRHFAVLKGGFGGHIHFVDFIAEPIFQQSEKFQEHEFKKGKTHGDTKAFSDEKVLKHYPPTYKIWKLKVFHDRKNVYGFQANYFVFGPNLIVEGERHVGNSWSSGVEDEIVLASDEFIVEIFGRHGDILDNFGVVTSKGRKFDFGGSGGNSFDVKAPKGHHFGVVAGGLGGHVHFVDFKPIPLHHFGGF